MIDLKLEIANFAPVDLALLVSDPDKNISENEKVSYVLYNNALDKIKLGNFDLARHDLKRSISINSDFSNAVILYGICLFLNGDRIGAVKLFNSVRDPEYREKSLGYLDMLAADFEKPNKEKPKKPVQPETNVYKTVQNIEKNTSKPSESVKLIKIPKDVDKELEFTNSELQGDIGINYDDKEVNIVNDTNKKNQGIISFAAKFCSIIAIIFVIVLLLLLNNLNGQNRNLQKKLTEQNTPVDSNTEVESMKEQINILTEQLDQSKILNIVNDARANYYNKNYYNAVIDISQLDMSKVPSEYIDEINNINEDSLNKFTDTNYNNTFALEEAGNYSEIINLLLPVYQLNPGTARMPGILFYLGKAYENTGDKNNALKYYMECCDKFPGTDYSGWSSYRIKVINGEA
jgi:tetratricopeptide (TPR) repeat protein